MGASARSIWARARVSLLIVVLSGLPLVLRIQLSSARVSNDDTWAYQRIYETFKATGHIRLINWNDISLVGMFPVTRVWGVVAGDGPIQLRLLGAVMAAVALAGLDSCLRSFRVKQRALPLIAMGVFAGFLATTGTYMADQFAFAGAIWSVALAARLATGTTRGWRADVLAAGVALCAVFAVTVRQTAGLSIVVAAMLLWSPDRRRRRALTIVASVFLPLAGAFLIWRSGRPNGGQTIINHNVRAALAGLVVLIVGIGLALLPTTLGRRRDRTSVIVALGAGAAAAVVVLAVHTVGYINDFTSVVRLVDAVPRALQPFVAFLAVAGAAYAACSLVPLRSIAARDPVRRRLLLGAALAVVADVLVVVLTSEYYSRYSLLTVALAVAVVAVLATPSRTSMLQWSAAAVIAFGGYIMLDRAVAPTRATLNAVAVAECAGIDRTRIDAGLTFVGDHYRGEIVSDYFHRPTIDDGLPFSPYLRAFPEFRRDAAVVTARPVERAGVSVAGPFHSSAVFPFDEPDAWVVVVDEFALRLDRCAIEAGA